MEKKKTNAKLRSLEATAIFGGIGGMELGLHAAGHTTSLFCESDPDATSVLRARFNEVPIAPDIRRTDEVAGMVSASSQLLTAGFPCTDLSQAGLTMGFSGGRSSLIRETLDLIRHRPFHHLLIENVPNWRHLHGGQYMAEVLAALEELGYRWAYRTIDALAFGLPQRRLRLFLYATLEGDPRDVLFRGSVEPDTREFPLNETAHGFYWTEGNRGLGWGEDCTPTLKGGSSMGIPSAPAILLPSGSIITPDIRDAERLQGFPQSWTDTPHGATNGHRFNQRRRWMLVGNAVNVEVSKWVGKGLATPQRYGGAEGIPLPLGAAWPAAAWFDGHQRYTATLTTWPVRRPRKPLVSFLRYEGSPLSVRATSGFYTRICASSLRFKPGFKAAVAKHLDQMSRVALLGGTTKRKHEPAAYAA